jgi:hypothetical protein
LLISPTVPTTIHVTPHTHGQKPVNPLVLITVQQLDHKLLDTTPRMYGSQNGQKVSSTQKYIFAHSVALLYSTHGIQFYRDHSRLIALTMRTDKKKQRKKILPKLIGNDLEQ